MKEKIKGAITKHRRKIILWSLGKREWYNKEWKGRKRVKKNIERSEERKNQQGRLCEKKERIQGIV